MCEEPKQGVELAWRSRFFLSSTSHGGGLIKRVRLSQSFQAPKSSLSYRSFLTDGQIRDDQHVNIEQTKVRIETRDREAAGIVARGSRRSLINPNVGFQVQTA